jgi:ADP-ribose pyrophosphatase YjhB (NUDIX family)
MKRPVPVVRLIVIGADGRALILRRQNSEHGNGQWCLPGGKVDYGETVAESVAKELKEETSLECLESQYLFFQDSLPIEPGKMHCINLYFECKTSGKLRLNSESDDFAWINAAELSRYELVFRNGEGLLQYWSGKTCA